MLQFEKHAEKYELVRRKITYPENLYNYLASLCACNNNALDIGCGNGVSTARLRGYFKNIKGIDIGSNLINFARTSFPAITFTVGYAEDISLEKKFDLITSATSFYWMDRQQIINKLPSLLNDSGVFCAYKYGFPLPYGKLHDYINFELATKWAPYRDLRLIEYDNTLEMLEQSNQFSHTGHLLISNTIELSPEEIAYFFLSTSYVTKYIEETGNSSYPQELIEECQKIDSSTLVKINFDIHAVYAKK